MRGTVKTHGLNLRAMPSMDGQIVDQLSRGDVLEIGQTSPNKHWIAGRVERTGQRGWVFASDVTLDAPVPDMPKMTPVQSRPNKPKAISDQYFWLWMLAVCVVVLLAYLGLR